MPINLTTGLPGSGKTLSTLVRVKELSERENRPVYYHGITDLQLSWKLLDNPKSWFALPHGSIIVIDECQDLFPVHETKLPAEPYVLELAKHRHRGYDLFLITQHPMNIHAFVRRLIDNHQNLIRAFGSKFSNVHEWPRVIDYPEKTKKDSQTKIFPFPKDAFNYYKSAELHTIQRKLPKKLIWIVVIPFLLAGLGYKAYSVLNPQHQREQILATNPEFKTNKTESNFRQQTDNHISNQEYFNINTPRVLGLEFTQPKYDEITKPSTAPIPAACVLMHQICKCYSQQGTLLQTSKDQCIQIVYNGFFQDFNPTPNPIQKTQSTSHENGIIKGETLDTSSTIQPQAIASTSRLPILDIK